MLIYDSIVDLSRQPSNTVREDVMPGSRQDAEDAKDMRAYIVH